MVLQLRDRPVRQRFSLRRIFSKIVFISLFLKAAVLHLHAEKQYSQNMIETWIGCSGFHYQEWKEVFYPKGLPQRKWFDYYSQQFNTLELNTTFYRFPQLRILQNWYNVSPEIYRFSVKAPRLITHYKQFKDSKRMLSDFYGTSLEGLRDKLG